MFKRSITRILLLILLLVVTSISVNAWEIDRTSQVISFIDGDSFYITNDQVRLADVNAPEYNQLGGTQSTNAIKTLLSGKTLYLDTDQKTGRDPYNRLVAVVYIKYNSTHYLNVNYALLQQGVVSLKDYSNNEFDPSTWTLYVRYANALPNTGVNLAAILGLIVLFAFLIVIVVIARKQPKGSKLLRKTPKYHGSKIGLIVKAIAIDDKHEYSEIRDQSGIPNDEFLKLVYHLLKSNELIGSIKGTFDIKKELKAEWRRYYNIRD